MLPLSFSWKIENSPLFSNCFVKGVITKVTNVISECLDHQEELLVPLSGLFGQVYTYIRSTGIPFPITANTSPECKEVTTMEQVLDLLVLEFLQQWIL